MKNILLFLFLAIILAACNQPTTSEAEVSDLALVPTSWIKERVSKAKMELNKSEAGKLIWQSMEAHGGLERWFANGPISFNFDYMPRGKGARRNTSEVMDTWRNQVVHRSITDPTAAFGWDGQESWVTMKDTAAFEFDLAFWTLTPIYLLGQPFLFDGAGVQLEHLGDKILDGITYDAVKISYAAGTGAAPDDFYINYLNKDNHQIAALRYIVSYPKYFKDGGHTPEKIITLHDFKTVNGIIISTSSKTYMLTPEEAKGEYVTDITVSKIQFLPKTKKAYFEIPAGAKILK